MNNKNIKDDNEDFSQIIMFKKYLNFFLNSVFNICFFPRIGRRVKVPAHISPKSKI